MAHDLEDLVEASSSYRDVLAQRVSQAYAPAKSFVVDVMASNVFFTPLMAMIEYNAGLECAEIAKVRTTAAVINLFTVKPYVMFRDRWAAAWGADINSSALKKALIDVSATALATPPTYGLILVTSNALGLSDVTAEEALYAMPQAVLMSACSGRPYGWFLDRWRTLFGEKPTM